MTSKSWRNMSGCWSYFVAMYCRMLADKAICVDFLNGSDRILDVLMAVTGLQHSLQDSHDLQNETVAMFVLAQ